MIAISGGGTGGHLAIAKALNEELIRCGKKTMFIGSSNGQDKMWFENDDKFSNKIFLSSRGVVNKRGFDKVASIFHIISLAFSCYKIFKKNNVKAVISVGGYSAAPASFAALLYGVPLFIHEQNAIIGKLNKILKPYARSFFSSYFNPIYNYPVANKFFKSQRVRQNLQTIIFLGGSQGANAINTLALKIAPALVTKGIKIIHQCGKNELKILQNKYKELNINDVDLFDFDKQIELKMQKADLAISRSGASTLWELVANLLPTIFIPYPYAAANHQIFNAKFLVDKGLAKFCFQKNNEIDETEILTLIESIKLSEISRELTKQIAPDGAKIIVDEILTSL